MEENLQHILKGCKKRNRNSQHELYKLFYAYGMSISIRYVKKEDEAIHVLNDSFMKVFTRIQKYNDQYDFKPWFRKIVVNTSIDYMKKQKQLQMKSQIEDAKHISDREDILSRIGYKELINLVQSLSTAYRTVFNMYVIDGYKHDEIAKTLNISVGTSKSNLSKARAQLRDMITQQLKLQHA
ncbi:MAG: RNA polymerase sigma factor [Bacteroidota bacterium]